MGYQKIQGTESNDKLLTGKGNQMILGLQGDDYIDGGAGYDIQIGGPGNDTYVIDSPLDQVIETSNDGIDKVIASSTLILGSNIENVELIGTKNSRITGNMANNVISGNSANNTLNGISGNDTINGSAGNDDIEGFTGDDSLMGDQGNDLLSGFTGKDTLIGGDGDDFLRGGSDNDLLEGGFGNDTLNGGSGSDTLTGGAGNDRFNLSLEKPVQSIDVGVDTIQDFVTGSDRLSLSRKSFTLLSSKIGRGFSNASEFFVASSDAEAKASSAHIAYNKTNGNLFYNDNLLATLVGAPALTSSNFSIAI